MIEARDDTVSADERGVIDRYLCDATRAVNAVESRASGCPRHRGR